MFYGNYICRRGTHIVKILIKIMLTISKIHIHNSVQHYCSVFCHSSGCVGPIIGT